MRVTTLVNKLIGLQGLWVRNFHFQADKAGRGSREWWWMSYHGGGSLCAGFAVERSTRTKIANVALRQQLAVLRRSVKRPRLSNVDRGIETWLSFNEAAVSQPPSRRSS